MSYLDDVAQLDDEREEMCVDPETMAHVVFPNGDRVCTGTRNAAWIAAMSRFAPWAVEVIEGLLIYADHDNTCSADSWKRPPCTCGLDAFREQIERGPAPPASHAHAKDASGDCPEQKGR